jgi:hypothetical protein
MKTCVVAVALLAAGTAYADSPLDSNAVQYARSQAKDAKQIGDLYRGAGEKTDYQILLEDNTCYWFAGVSQGLEKLYFYLWKPNSGAFTPRVADMRSPGQGTMAYCTKEPGMYKFQVKTEGKGHYVVALFGKEAPKAVARPAEPAAAVVEKTGPDLGPLCDKRAKAAAPAAKRVGDFFEGSGNSIGHDDRFDYPIQLDAGHCYWMIACGEPEKVKSISLYLWGPNNKRITEAKSDTPNPMLGHCANETGMFKFQAKITGGGGHFKAALYAK